MKRVIRCVAVFLCLAAICGCRTSYSMMGAMEGVPSTAAMMSDASGESALSDVAEVRADRMLIWTANMRLEVDNLTNVVKRVGELAEAQGGYVEQKSEQGDCSASMRLRIPAKAFNSAIAGLEVLGKVLHKTVEGQDVTEIYIDVEAKLKNKIALRDRMKQLLEKAADVKDVLAIEAELERTQSAIDSMEGRIKALKGQVDYATVSLSLVKTPEPAKKRILGPLGYLFKGLWWSVEKLFIIRE